MTQPTPQSLDALAVGRSGTDPFITVIRPVDPTPYDVNYPIQKRWVNSVDNSEFILKGFDSSSGVILAQWIPITSGSGILTVTGNTGGPVGPDGVGNVTFVGDGTTVTIAGNPGTNTMTVSTAGAVATSYVEDVGAAVPALGILNIVGGVGIDTTGAGNTVTIDIDASLASTYTENIGVAMPVGNNLNVLGAGGIVTTGAADTITITPGASIATQYTEDVGTAVPAANNLNVVGSGPITTTGLGSTITIGSNGTLATTYTENVGAAVPAAGVLNIFGMSGIDTTGAGNTVTISPGSTIATSYVEDVGVAMPAANSLNIVGGAGITTSGAGNTVTITATGSGFAWQQISANQALVNSTGYFCVAPGGALLLSLPAVSTTGDSIAVVLRGATSWTITQPNAGSQIFFGNNSTTLGVGGSLSSTAQGDAIELVCQTNNGIWVVVPGYTGTLTPV